MKLEENYCATANRQSVAIACQQTREIKNNRQQWSSSNSNTLACNNKIANQIEDDSSKSSGKLSAEAAATAAAAVVPRQILKQRNELTSIIQNFKTGPSAVSCCGNKFHRAAIDGYVDMLCEATKRDTNLPALDHHLQLTPTLLASQHGQLEALRILVGRGGDPERVSSRGSSALHLAAERNHLNCVSFLVNFGVNMWALDDELRTAKDVAAIEQCTEVLNYLDQMMAKQSAINTKLVQKFKDKAKNAAEKRLKHMRKLQMKAIKQVERDERLLAKMSQSRRLLKQAHSMSDIRLVNRTSTNEPLVAQQLHHQHHHQHQHQAISLLPHCDTGNRKPLASTGSATEQSNNSAQSNRIANYIQQRLQDDLLAGTRRARAKQQQQLFGSSASANSSSYPASSVSSSSTSGYLSSFSAKSILKSAPLIQQTKAREKEKDKKPVNERDCAPEERKQGGRPKYSDLVAVKRDELSLSSARSSSLINQADDPNESITSTNTTTTTSNYKKMVKQEQQQQQQLQGKESSSVIVNKLRGVIGGGVSRKVHLKRLLFAPSTCNTTNSSHTKKGPPSSESVAQLDQTKQLKACTKFKSADRYRSQAQLADCHDARDNGCSPATPLTSSRVMKRTRSEPDFNAVAAALQEEEDDDNVSDDDSNGIEVQEQATSRSFEAGEKGAPPSRCAGPFKAEQSFQEQSGGRPASNGRQQCNAIYMQEPPPLPPPLPGKHKSAGPGLGRIRSSGVASASETQQQHLLLNQCLSQLKIKQQQQQQQQSRAAAASILNESSTGSSSRSSPSTSSGCNQQQQQQQQQFSHSDELLQHQLEAGQFALKPSIIKHQKQRHNIQLISATTSQHQSQRQASSDSGSRSSQQSAADDNDNDDRDSANKSATLMSIVDSIGSASSFARKNSRPDSASPPPPPLVEQLCQQQLGQQMHQQQQQQHKHRVPSSSSALSSFESYAQSNCSAQNETIGARDSSQQQGQGDTDMNNNNNNNKCQLGRRRDSTDLLCQQPFSNKTSSCNQEKLRLIEFLAGNNLADLFEILSRERIDFEALLLLNDLDLKSLNILLGPRKKLLNAIERHKRSLQTVGFKEKGQGEEEEGGERSPLVSATVVVDTQF